MPTLEYENKYKGKLVAGLDEVGRGCLAGPVVTALVILPKDVDLPEIDDSKKISKTKHKTLVEKILKQAITVSIGLATSKEIDDIGILNAVKLAMTRSVENAKISPEVLLIDGDTRQLLPNVTLPQETIVKGDSKSLSIAAASLVAKSIRDTLMIEYTKEFPHYGWESNAGYGTEAHIKAIEKYGVTKHHRMTFKPLRKE